MKLDIYTDYPHIDNHKFNYGTRVIKELVLIYSKENNLNPLNPTFCGSISSPHTKKPRTVKWLDWLFEQLEE